MEQERKLKNERWKREIKGRIKYRKRQNVSEERVWLKNWGRERKNKRGKRMRKCLCLCDCVWERETYWETETDVNGFSGCKILSLKNFC
jgi:hypothetical protein